MRVFDKTGKIVQIMPLEGPVKEQFAQILVQYTSNGCKVEIGDAIKLTKYNFTINVFHDSRNAPTDIGDKVEVVLSNNKAKSGKVYTNAKIVYNITKHSN
jgi:hypothetical protein